MLFLEFKGDIGISFYFVQNPHSCNHRVIPGSRLIIFKAIINFRYSGRIVSFLPNDVIFFFCPAVRQILQCLVVIYNFCKFRNIAPCHGYIYGLGYFYKNDAGIRYDFNPIAQIASFVVDTSILC